MQDKPINLEFAYRYMQCGLGFFHVIIAIVLFLTLSSTAQAICDLAFLNAYSSKIS